MKKNIAAIAALAMICSTAAVSCGNDVEDSEVSIDLPAVTTESPEEASTEASTESASSETTTASTTKKAEKETTTTAETEEETTEAETEAETEAPTEAEDEPSAEPLKFSFAMLNGDLSEIRAAYGEPTSKSSAPSCLSNGADQEVYEYGDDLTVKFYIMNGAEHINGIIFRSNKYSTSKGITIGSTKSEVDAAYGEGNDGGSGLYYYMDGENELDVTFDSNDIAVEIEFYAPA